MAGFPWNQWQLSFGMGGSFRVESVAGLAWNTQLPFDPLVPNAETIAAMKEARAGKLVSFNTISELMDDLNDEED